MDASGQNYKDTFRYTDVEYTPDGHTDVYRWDDFLGIAGGHVYSAMYTIDMVEECGGSVTRAMRRLGYPTRHKSSATFSFGKRS